MGKGQSGAGNLLYGAGERGRHSVLRVGQRIGNCAGERQDECRVSRMRILEIDSAAMFLRNPMGDRQPQSNAAPLAVTHERLKQSLADGRRYARATIRNAQLNHLRSLYQTNLDQSRLYSAPSGLSGINEEIEYCPLDHSRVHPHLCLGEMFNLNRYRVRFRVNLNQRYSTLCQGAERLIHRMQGFPRAAENKQRLEHVGHPLYCKLHFCHQLIPLCRRRGGTAQELCVRINCGEIMPKIVRDGTSHASDDSHPRGFDELLLRLPQLIAHGVKRLTELSKLLCPSARQLIVEIARTKSARSGKQRIERARNGSRDIERQQGATISTSNPCTRSNRFSRIAKTLA